MSLEGPKRVHIAPLGYEQERIYKPAIEMNADEVILVVHEDRTDQSEKCEEVVKEALEEESIEVSDEDCNFFDLQDAMYILTDIVGGKGDNTYRINISSGSKITAIAGMFVCMMYDAIPYYVKVEGYGEEPISHGVADSFSVPTYPIQLIDKDYIEVLEFLKVKNEDDAHVVIKDLNEFVQENELSVVEDSERDDTDIYDIVRPQIIEPLRERDYISLQRRGNEKVIELTSKGKDALQITKYAI